MVNPWNGTPGTAIFDIKHGLKKIFFLKIILVILRTGKENKFFKN
jgi:hypothetical protein